MEAVSASLYAHSSTYAPPSAPNEQVPRTLPAPELVKADWGFTSPSKRLNVGQMEHSDPLSLSAEYDADTDDSDGSNQLSRTLTSRATLAPGPPTSTRTLSPAPLAWSDTSFTFAPFDSQTPAPSTSEARSVWPASQAGSTSSSSSDGAHSLNMVGTPSTSTSAVSSSPTLRSKLAPTASAFVPKVSAFTPVAPPPHLASLDTASPFAFNRSGRLSGNSSSPSSSPVEPCTPPPFPPQQPEAHLDFYGRLVTSGARYAIADEILQLQGRQDPDELETLEQFDPMPSSSRSRTVSEGNGFIRGIEQWRLQHSPIQPATFPLRLGAFPPGPSSASGSYERSRSSSICSTTSSYFAPRPALERAATAAQLQSYFGPTPGGGIEPALGGFDYFDPTYPVPPPGARHLSRTSSFGNLQGPGGGPLYPPLAHPEPFNLTPDDPLYLQARDVFVESSCSPLTGPPTSQHRNSMVAHFDRAMHTLNPLATLYGLSQEAANQLLNDPAKSGVSDVVLKVAAMRGRQQQMASVQRSAMGAVLPGPSPNNRKLGLYKTELCRSWEEKGSCRYGVKCQFAHGIHELREVARHPKFKSEICRTFWQQGSCPYGKRCCFIHASGDANDGSSSPTKGSAPGSRAESPVEQTSSRLNSRMTSTAITSAPSRTFGPALSELISSSSSSSTGSSLQNSPRQSLRPEPNASAAPAETSALFGLGISQRPGQAPPTFREEPKSRLHRLTSLSGSSCSTPSTIMSPALPATVNVSAFQPHARHDSANSFMTTSSTSSSVSMGPTQSPLLARSGSTSSLSSAGSPILLRPLGGEWLAGSNASAAKSAALDWPQEMEHLSLDDVAAPL
ncbi:hypothetical protein JCM8097_002162 [Rhodosporidiobolus ruineniae]